MLSTASGEVSSGGSREIDEKAVLADLTSAGIIPLAS